MFVRVQSQGNDEHCCNSGLNAQQFSHHDGLCDGTPCWLWSLLLCLSVSLRAAVMSVRDADTICAARLDVTDVTAAYFYGDIIVPCDERVQLLQTGK
jgi:hypothetical protein